VSPAVSVVTSVRNGARYLRGSVESVLGQEGVDLEFILIDDGSTDESGSILDDFARRDSRVRVVHQTNSGLTKALIRGCEMARGIFLARHDADDVSLPGRLAAQALLLGRDPGVSFVSSWARVIGPKDEVLREETREGARPRCLREGEGPLGHGSVMMRRQAYDRAGGYRAQFRYAQDWDLWWRMAEQGSFAMIPEFLYAYRFDDAGTSAAHRDLQQKFGALARACAEARAKQFPEDDLLAEAERLSKRPRRGRTSRAAADYFIGRSLVRRRDPAARGYLWKSLRRQPWRLRAWISLLELRLRRDARR
jgi:glycosyltransferase involved in cell wall biosynthesis